MKVIERRCVFVDRDQKTQNMKTNMRFPNGEFVPLMDAIAKFIEKYSDGQVDNMFMQAVLDIITKCESHRALNAKGLPMLM